MRHFMTIVFVICSALGLQPDGVVRTSLAEATTSGSTSVMVYHRFGENPFPATNVRLQQFDRHLATLKEGTYHFPDMPELISRLANDQGLIDHSIMITVDDAYLSVFTQAWPRLKKHGIPLTVFVTSDEADNPGEVYMSWDQLRQLKSEGVTIGHHGATHKSLIDMSVEEARADLEFANARFREELGEAPDILAWPFGEYSQDLIAMVQDMGFKAAFSQSSGGLGATSNRYALPRFAINEQYGAQERFDLVLKAVSLPVRDVLPQNPVLTEASNPPMFGFTLAEDLPNINALACYPSNSENAAKVHLIGNHRVEVRFDKPFPEGRGRVNCTLPAKDGRWYWFGMPFFVKAPQ